jgi:phosphoenolpyruvate-protein kinase (PTS system EI component)
MKTIRVAGLVPGRAFGELETDLGRAIGNKILLLRQEQLGQVSGVPGGLVLVDAAPLSHPVIHWLGRGIPVALVDNRQATQWERGDPVLLDSARGQLQHWEADYEPEPWLGPGAPTAGQPVATLDGAEIRLCASVGGTGGARRAVAAGAASIGLVRSEYLVPADACRPTEAFYRRAFSELLNLSEPLVVTIRLVDLAADKWPDWLARTELDNTHSTLHGSQLFSGRPLAEVVDSQLAALRRIGAKSRLRLIWPSGGNLEDFLRWREAEAGSLPSGVPLGAMVETPIELLALDQWAREADFACIGCNDLLANVCAADRDDPRQRELLDPYRPELYRLFREAAERATTGLDQVQLCGLLPQIEGVLPLFIGLGFRQFSGEPALIPLLARRVAKLSLHTCKALVETVCDAVDSRQVRRLIGIPAGVQWGLVGDDALP